MIKRLSIFIIFIVLLLFPIQSISGNRMSVSISHLKLEKGERIMGFSITVYQGTVVALPNIPPVWTIRVENIGNSKVTANAIEGTAAFSDTKFFSDFIVVEKNDQPIDPFNIEVNIDTTKDFENFKSKVFKMKDLKLIKVKK